MSTEAQNFAWCVTGINAKQKFVLLTLAFHFEFGAQYCVVTLERLSLVSGLSPRTIRRAMIELIHYGIILKAKRAVKGTNAYKIVGFNNDEGDQLGNQVLMDNFDRFWHEYPKKQDKQRCIKWWLKHKPTTALTDTMINHVNELCKNTWTRDKMQFIPMPSTWLNGERWNDELPEDSGAYKGGENEHLLYL